MFYYQLLASFHNPCTITCYEPQTTKTARDGGRGNEQVILLRAEAMKIPKKTRKTRKTRKKEKQGKNKEKPAQNKEKQGTK